MYIEHYCSWRWLGPPPPPSYPWDGWVTVARLNELYIDHIVQKVYIWNVDGVKWPDSNMAVPILLSFLLKYKSLHKPITNDSDLSARHFVMQAYVEN